MHWSYDHLDLSEDADARAIKRAYARQLKTARPDVDPDGFQRLHEAYQAALQVCARRAAAAADDDAVPEPRLRDTHAREGRVEDTQVRDTHSGEGRDQEGHVKDTQGPQRRVGDTRRRRDTHDVQDTHVQDTHLQDTRDAAAPGPAAPIADAPAESEAGVDSHAIDPRALDPHGDGARGAGRPGTGGRGEDGARVADLGGDIDRHGIDHALDDDLRTHDVRPHDFKPHDFRPHDFSPAPDAYGDGPWRPLPSPFASEPADADPWATRSLAEQVLSMASASDADTLAAWLQAQPALWSLADKGVVADAVAEILLFEGPDLGVAQFDALAGFFGLFDLKTGHDTQMLLAVRDRLALAEALADGDVRALAERLQPEGSSRAARQREIRRLLQQLRRRWSWPQALAMALVPGLPSRLQRFSRTLRGLHDGELPERLDARQGAFWEAAGDGQRWSWPRATVLALRLVLYPLALPLLSWLLQPGTLAPEVAGRRYLAVFLALGLGWAGLRLSLAFAQWQAVEDPPDARWAWLLRGAAVPVLLAVGLFLHFLPGTELLSWLLVPPLAMGTVARVAGSSYSTEALVVLLRQGWVWVLVPVALALFGAFAGSGTVRGAVYVLFALVGYGLCYGAATRR